MNFDPVSNSEFLTRFIVRHDWVRKKDNHIYPAAFMPPKNLKLSVTRLLHISQKDIWNLGQQVVQRRQIIERQQFRLYGRADIEALNVRNQNLDIEPQPQLDNPNHANIINWPESKDKQNIIAMEIAVSARFVVIEPFPY